MIRGLRGGTGAARLAKLLGVGLIGCVHTPPHEDPPASWHKDFVRREEMRESGDYCSWECESLRYAGVRLWGADPPEGENWCGTPAEQSRYFDAVGQDGPFLSVQTVETGCCPEKAMAGCATWNLLTGKPATLDEYDQKHAAKRWAKAQEIAAGAEYAGLMISEDMFLVRPDGHVAFCAVPAAGAETVKDIREILVK